MEWSSAAIVVDARPLGECDAIVTVLAEQQGLTRGLVKGGQSRTRRACWQAGNIITARWRARLPEQLGMLDGELLQAVAALVMHQALPLAVLSSCCALAEQALPEREACDPVVGGLLGVLSLLGQSDPVAPAIGWELRLLSGLGYGLDLSCCAISGAATELAFVSPRTGRAVSEAESAPWRDRLLTLPRFLRPAWNGVATPEDWRDGLLLTGHFLARDVFGQRHRPVPAARRMFYDHVSRLANR